MGKKKSLEIATDKLGQDVKVGSIVVAPNGNRNIQIGRVTRITPKMVRVDNINSRWSSDELKYHDQIVCIDEMEQTVLYLLSRNL